MSLRSFATRQPHFFPRTPQATKRLATVSALAVLTLTAASPSVFAAKSAGCSTAPFTIAARVDGGTSIAAVNLPELITVTGVNVEFQVDTATMGIRNFTLTGSATASDRLTNKPLVVFASKSPDLRGAALTSAITVDNNGGTLNLTRSGSGVTIKIQAVDCASGGIFQLEGERADGTSTDFTHVLGPNVFYFNNPRFGPPPPPLPLCPAPHGRSPRRRLRRSRSSTLHLHVTLPGTGSRQGQVSCPWLPFARPRQ
jgi:hypothetical protein